MSCYKQFGNASFGRAETLNSQPRSQGLSSSLQGVGRGDTLGTRLSNGEFQPK